MEAMVATDKAVEVELLGEREFFCNGDPFDMKDYRNLSPEDQRYLDRVADAVYDLPVFEDGYVTARYNKFSVRIKAQLVKEDEKMNGYRKYMQANGGNLGWCKPYISDDGKFALSVNEGKVSGMLLNGEDVEDFENPERLADFARAVNPYYTDYSGWGDLHIALDGSLKEWGCADCPWFSMCDAMDNPDGWDENPLSQEYVDE